MQWIRLRKTRRIGRDFVPGRGVYYSCQCCLSNKKGGGKNNICPDDSIKKRNLAKTRPTRKKVFLARSRRRKAGRLRNGVGVLWPGGQKSQG